MRKLPRETRALVLSALTEGMGVNATARMCNVSKLTVLRLLRDAGAFALEFHDATVRQLPTVRVEVDELWSFVGCKARTKLAGESDKHGDAWCWVAIDADSKLVVSYIVGDRNKANAMEFIGDLKSRLVHRIQLSSDAFKPYFEAVRRSFGFEVDYGQVVKKYAPEAKAEARYSPPVCVGCTKRRKIGSPAGELISTSYSERLNLTIRTQTRRYTRLTNGWSRIIGNHVAATALQFLAYNFVKKHAALKTTPAVAVGLAERPLTVLDLVDMIEVAEIEKGGRLSDYRPSPKRTEPPVVQSAP